MHVLGSRVFGFNQELFDDTGGEAIEPEVAALMARQMADAYPNIADSRKRSATRVGWVRAMTTSNSRSAST